ncbi:MAG TPA: YbaK/EbsC family protein [Anaerolineae bacterium]|nr:YbaK/EbsC family protein [Anaerolineae bacterium]
MSNPYEERLHRFMAEQQIQAEHLSFQESCHSVAEAARAVNAAADDLVKNICVVDAEGNLIVAIVKGEDRVSLERVGQVLGIAPPRLATAQEILDKSGYPCGGTPSFGYPATFLIDPRVFEKEVVYTGGGSETALMKVAPRELQRANNGRIETIRK